MPNPLFNALNSGNNSPMMQQFSAFMRSMRGRDPKAEVEALLRSGRISQAQLNDIQAQAQQMQSLFAPFIK